MPPAVPELNAGRLNKRITIEEDIGTEASSTGEHVEDFQFFANRWAEIIPLSGRELWNAQQVQPDITHKVTIRYLTGVTPKMRVAYGSRYFNILSVINVNEEGISQELMCMESV